MLGSTIGVCPSLKNGDGFFFPKTSPLNKNGIICIKLLTDIVAGVPAGAGVVANFPIMRALIGPKVFSKAVGSFTVNIRKISPVHGMVGFVFPIGVLQHVVEKRYIPVGERRTSFRFFSPDKNLILAG